MEQQISSWKEKYAEVKSTLMQMGKVESAATAFNTNVDAVLKIKGRRLAELAKELGYDAGFGMNTYADDVASFVAQEFVRRKNK